VGRPEPSLRHLSIESREVYHGEPIRRGEKRVIGRVWRLGDTVLAIVYQAVAMIEHDLMKHPLGSADVATVSYGRSQSSELCSQTGGVSREGTVLHLLAPIADR
jgi:hypothetical protein